MIQTFLRLFPQFRALEAEAKRSAAELQSSGMVRITLEDQLRRLTDEIRWWKEQFEKSRQDEHRFMDFIAERGLGRTVHSTTPTQVTKPEAFEDATDDLTPRMRMIGQEQFRDELRSFLKSDAN